MRTVRSFISYRRRHLIEHPFFERLQRNEPLSRVLPLLPNLTFWAMSFEKNLEYAEARIEEWRLAQMTRQQREKSKGLEKRFIADLLELHGQAEPRNLIGRAHELVRESTYALSFEALRAADDYERIALLLALESSGFTLFDRICGYLERQGVRSLRFLAAQQLREPQGSDGPNAFFSLLELPPTARQAACAVVDRVFQACTAMLDGFEGLLTVPGASSRAALGGEEPGARASDPS